MPLVFSALTVLQRRWGLILAVCVPQDSGPAVTPGPALCAEARAAAQRLLDHYVQVQGAAVAQMLRKSVETRDWLGTVEPRNVRAVMKRVVEDITAIDVQVGLAPGLRGLDTPGAAQGICPRSLCCPLRILQGCGRVAKTLRDAGWFGGVPGEGFVC